MNALQQRIATIAATPPGVDFDIDGETYRIVYLRRMDFRSERMRADPCVLCPAQLACGCTGCRTHDTYARPQCIRAVVPVREIPRLAVEGDLA